MVSTDVTIRQRFLRGVDYIEAHLLEPVALADVAGAAGLSLHYFSRLFRVLSGEPFGAYLRGRRLTVAAERLAGGGAGSPKLVELAFDCGYDSQEAFTRAFKRSFGVTPGAYRKRRFGQLMLDGGRLAGRPLVPADYARESLTARVSTGGAGFPPGYGYQWWISDLPVASGNGGQRIVVDRARGMIVVITAGLYDSPRQVEAPMQVFEAVRDAILR
jgi:AraC-like DNA-binding protein